MRRRIINVLAGTASVLALDCALLSIASAQGTRDQKRQDVSDAASSLPRRMLDHGLRLLESGDVPRAREFLEISASDGNGEAAHLLASTYDAAVLRQRKLAVGLADDAEKVRWSKRARDLGYVDRAALASTNAAQEDVRAVRLGAGTVSASAVSPAAGTANAFVAPAPAPANAPSRSPAKAVDGTYSAHVPGGCGEGFQSVLIKIERGQIAFEHLMKGVPYGWRGTIDDAGVIDAQVAGVAGHVASGRFDEKSIDLTYPQCGATPLSMRIRWLVR